MSTTSPEPAAGSQSLEAVAHLCAAVTVALGCVVLLGWALGVDALVSVLPDRNNMKANTALALLLAGGALASAIPERRPRSRPLAVTCGLAAAGLGLLTLLQYRFGWDLGVDELLVREVDPPAGTAAPGRMAEASAACLFLIGTALAGIDVRVGRHRPSRWLAVAVAVVAYLAVLGHAYGVSSLYSFTASTQMALNTSLALLVVSVGVVCARPAPALTAVLASTGPDGVLVRRVLPAAFGVLTLLGGLTLAGARAELFDGEFGVSLLVVSSIASVCGLVVVTAGHLGRSEASRRRAEVEAMRQNRRLQAIVDQLPAGVHVKDLGGRYELVNQRLERFLGRPKEAILGRTARDLFPPDTAAAIEQTDQRVLASAAPVELEERAVMDGEEHLFLSLRFPLVGADGRAVAVCGISTDVTERLQAEEERRSLEARLAQAERLEALGQLAGGVAHDFNNLLTVVVNCAAFVAPVVEHDAEARDDVAQIERAAARGAELTRSLLAFSRREPVHPEVVDVNALVVETCALLERTLGDDVDVEVQGDPGLWPVTVDPGSLSQVLMNLAVNARHAMPSGGRLSFRTTNVALGDLAAPAQQLPPGRYVRITVVDTGIGMEPDVQARAFDPFFSTRPSGVGTGLGLASAFGAVTQAGGQIQLYSEPGVGTAVKVHLPAAGQPVGAVTPPPAEGEVDLTGIQVLLVEDAPEVRQLAARVLEHAGVDVVVAGGGEEALAVLAAGQRPDLLVTDVMMPVLTGPELAERVGALLPGLPVVFVSGYPEGVLSHGGVVDQGVHLVEKPFSEDDLLRAVRTAVGRSDETRR
jgi:two-component system, cell cycle sensor histidine kinase and response regulator CckA